jgi:hypothetical protein
MSITTMGAKIQAFDIFQTPLSSHYPLPLSLDYSWAKVGICTFVGLNGTPVEAYILGYLHFCFSLTSVP